MSATALNFEAIVKARDHHNRVPGGCPEPPHTVVMNPFDIERLGWEVGDTIAGMTLVDDHELQSERFRLLCDAVASPTGDVVEAVAEDRDKVIA